VLPAANVDNYDRIADVYSLFFGDWDRTLEDEGAWLARVLRSLSVRKVLDACCGNGRQSLPLCRNGFQIVGADPSVGMLREASIAALRHRLDLPLVRSSFAELPILFDSNFDAVVALGNGLCHQETASDVLQALTSMRRCCHSDGVCVIGIKDFDRIKQERPRFHHFCSNRGDQRNTILFQIWDCADPILIVSTFVFTRATSAPGSSESRWVVRMTQTHEYMLGADELATLAHNAGFSCIERLNHPSEAVFLLR
jgi:glycine/sarcosine N-methyltransferase